MVVIRLMTPDDREAFLAHNERYLPTSGEGGVHFMPFDTRSGQRPAPVDFAMLDLPIVEPRWQRWFRPATAKKPP